MKSLYPRVLSMIICSFILIECTSENEDNEQGALPINEIDSGYEPIPEKLKPFVGYWTRGNHYSALFFQEGICYIRDGIHGGINNYVYEHHFEWDYNNTTQILSTTYGMGQWKITLSTDASWTGIGINLSFGSKMY